MSDRLSRIVFACLLLCASLVRSQSVSLGQYPQFVSYLADGSPNAFGCVWTYSNGTTSPLSTQTDYNSGTNNPNPVPLSAGGTANIWYQTGLLYTVVVKSFGGVNCASGSTILTVNGVNSTLLNTANTWNAAQTFNATTFFTLSDLQLVFGSPGTQTTLDIPPTASNLILHGPPITANDTLLSQNATQTVTNKNLTSGTQVNGCGMTGSPGTYVCIANNGSTATVLNSLAVLTGAPSTATVAPASSSSTIIGIVTAGAGITGSATIQQSGLVSCNFDGATTAGDYIQVSSTIAGDCHDAGATNTAGFGRVLSTNGGSGLYSIDFFGPGLSLNVLGQASLASFTAGVGAGTAPSPVGCNIGVTCFDNGGQLVVGVGTGPTTGAILTITFGGAHNNNACTIWPAGNNSAALSGATQVSVGGNSGTSFTINTGASALTASTAYTWNYTCTFH